jgi:hypothetical protein
MASNQGYNPFSAESLARYKADFAASGISNKPKSYNEFYNVGSGWAMPEQTAEEAAWTNSAYNPTQNDNGYTRFDPNVYGGGLERSKNFEAGARTFAKYQQLKPGQPGYDHAQGALKKLNHNFGIDNWRSASPRQLFESFDLEMRGLQEDNQKENFKFGLVDAAKLAAAAAVTWATAGAAAPYFGTTAAGTAATGALAGAAGATTSGVLNNNLSLKKVGTGAVLGGIGGYLSAPGGDPGSWAGGAGPYSDLASGTAGTVGTTTANNLGKFALDVGGAYALSKIGGGGGGSGSSGSSGSGGSVGSGGVGSGSDRGDGGSGGDRGDGSGNGLAKGAALLGILGGGGSGSGSGSGGGGGGGGGGQEFAQDPNGGGGQNAFLGGVAYPAQEFAQDPYGGGASGFNYQLPGALAGGRGASPQGGRNLGSMGAGKMQAAPGRTPGYQVRPFANYLMRG